MSDRPTMVMKGYVMLKRRRLRRRNFVRITTVVLLSIALGELSAAAYAEEAKKSGTGDLAAASLHCLLDAGFCRQLQGRSGFHWGSAPLGQTRNYRVKPEH